VVVSESWEKLLLLPKMLLPVLLLLLSVVGKGLEVSGE